MNFDFITKLIQSIIDAIQTTAIQFDERLQLHTFKAQITNPTKLQDVKGTVIVGNQKKVEEEIKTTRSVVVEIMKTLKAFKFPTQIKVSNPTVIPPYPRFPTEIKVSNFELPVIPKTVSVSNQPTEEINKVTDAISLMHKTLKALKLEPKINVEAPKAERVIIPPANVTVNEKEIDYEKMAKTIAEQIPEIDYKLLAKTLSDEMTNLVITGGGGSSGSGQPAFADVNNQSGSALINALRQVSVVQEERWGLNDSLKSGTDNYTGEEDVDGNWIVRKISKTSTTVSMRYATIKNNKTMTDYASAWADPTVLKYDVFSVAF